jgi:hypothetical protein
MHCLGFGSSPVSWQNNVNRIIECRLNPEFIRKQERQTENKLQKQPTTDNGTRKAKMYSQLFLSLN